MFRRQGESSKPKKKRRRKNKTTEFPLVYGRQSELSGSAKQPARQEPRDLVEELIHSTEANAGGAGGRLHCDMTDGQRLAGAAHHG